MAAQNPNQDQIAMINPAHAADVDCSIRAAERVELLTLDRYMYRYKYDDEIIETIETLARLAYSVTNATPTPWEPVSISLGRDFVTVRVRSSRVTLRPDRVVVRTGNAVLVERDAGGDGCFVLLTYVPSGHVVARVVAERLTWDGTEEVFTAPEFREYIKSHVRAILRLAEWVLR